LTESLFSALTLQICAREVMLPVLLLPLAVPVMIAAVEATRGTLNGDPYAFYSQWLHLCSHLRHHLPRRLLLALRIHSGFVSTPAFLMQAPIENATKPQPCQ